MCEINSISGEVSFPETTLFDVKNAQVLFSKESGNANFYRIPSLCYLGKGRVVACADERFFGSGDNPNRVDKVVRISKDYGKTWSPQITAVKGRGESKNKSSAKIDPSLLYDETNDQLFMLFSHTPAGVGILNCKQTNGYKDGYKLLKKAGKLYQIKNNEVYEGKQSTGITVDEEGNLSSGGNYSDDTSEFKEMKTAFLMVVKSDDGGLTWGKPIDLNPTIKKDSWRFIGACPGAGIQIKEGKHKGRLVFTVYYSVNAHFLNLTCSCLYSDDFGKTWHIGSHPEIKGRFPQNKPFFIPPRSWLSETQVVESGNGNLIAYIRNHHPKRLVMMATSQDGGASFGRVSFVKEAMQPICQISALSFHHKGKSVIAILNSASKTKRENGTIRLSIDGGKTFPYSKLLFPSDFIYSSMIYLGNGILGILYEDTLEHTCIKYITLAVDEVLP